MKPLFLATLLVVAAGLGGLTSLQASSSSEELVDLQNLVRQADWIADVEVLDAQCLQLPDGRIQTRYTLSTILPMKGTMPAIQEVLLPGGVVGQRGMIVPGMPVIEIGDRQILFLSEADPEIHWRMPVGLSTGAFEVIVQPGRSHKVVRDLRTEDGGALEVGEYDALVSRIFTELEE